MSKPELTLPYHVVEYAILNVYALRCDVEHGPKDERTVEAQAAADAAWGRLTGSLEVEAK